MGVAGGLENRGSSINRKILRGRLLQLLTDYMARRRRPSKGVNRRNNFLVPVTRFYFGPRVVATASLGGPRDDLKQYILNSSDPLCAVVETYPDTSAHFVIEIAQLLRANKDGSVILHKNICAAFRQCGIHLRLNHRHRSDGDELMSREEAAVIREQPDGGMGTV